MTLANTARKWRGEQNQTQREGICLWARGGESRYPKDQLWSSVAGLEGDWRSPFL